MICSVSRDRAPVCWGCARGWRWQTTPSPPEAHRVMGEQAVPRVGRDGAGENPQRSEEVETIKWRGGRKYFQPRVRFLCKSFKRQQGGYEELEIRGGRAPKGKWGYRGRCGWRRRVWEHSLKVSRPRLYHLLQRRITYPIFKPRFPNLQNGD